MHDNHDSCEDLSLLERVTSALGTDLIVEISLPRGLTPHEG
jgi:hypothetical protein